MSRKTWVAALALLLVGCSSSKQEPAPAAESAGGAHGLRFSEYPWLSWTAGTQELKIVDLGLDNCSMSIWQGEPGALERQPAICNDAELAEGRALFSDARLAEYRAAAVSVDTPNESGERRTKVIIDSGKGETPSSLLFPADLSSGPALEMLAYFERLFAAYAP